MPVILIIALGKLLAKSRVFPEGFARCLNLLTYWVALPALLLDQVTNATFESGNVARLSLLLVIATVASIFAAYIAVLVFRLNRQQTGAFVQGSARSNNAFIGLPVILYALSHIDGVQAFATVALAPAIVFYNIMSITVLLIHSERKENHPLLKSAALFVKQLVTNPMLLACVAGLTLNYFGFKFPLMIQRSLSTIGASALALALLSIGAALSFKGANHGLRFSITASAIKVFIQPLIGLGLALLWDIPPMDRKILLIYLACPTAVVSYALADIFGSDKDLAAHIIVISTVMSIISLSLIVAFG